jgi:hypothetical protein
MKTQQYLFKKKVLTRNVFSASFCLLTVESVWPTWDEFTHNLAKKTMRILNNEVGW